MNTTCPVCTQPVDPAASPSSTYKGVTYYLRCPHCKNRFDDDPERFIAAPGGGCEHGADGCHDHVIQLERLHQ